MTATALPSEIRLHPLLISRDGDAWIAGRRDTGEFVELPEEGITFLRALEAGTTVAGAQDRVRAEHDIEVDGAEFVECLVDLGFVAALDGEECGESAAPPSLRWLRPGHVSWIYRTPVYLGVLAFIAAGFAAATLRHDLVPSYQVYFITEWQGVNIAWGTAMFVATVAIHELSHLSAARAANVYARIGLGTRLQMLAAQTTVCGLWGAPRRIRFRVYLAGMVMDLVIASACSLTISIAEPTGFARASLEALILALLLSVMRQFALYMRTDMYFVVQEAVRCKDLYADAWAYVHYLGRRAVARLGGSAAPADPTLAVSAHERKPIKVYAVIMAAGSLVTLTLFAAYGGPILATLVTRSARHVVHGLSTGNMLEVLDGSLVIAVEGALQFLFLKVFFAKHGPRLIRGWRFVRTRISRGRSADADHALPRLAQ